MSWEMYNLGLMQSADFSIRAQRLVLPVFESATIALEGEWKKEAESYKQKIADAYKVDESEGSIISSEMDWEEDLYRQRKQAVGALALDWLMCSLKDALHGAKTYLDSAHPPKPPYKKGDGWLGNVIDEYQKRFGIDLRRGPMTFDRLQELVLARNAGIHRSPEILEEYLRKVAKPAFIDGDRQFFVTREALFQIIQECEVFIKWAVAEIEKLAKAAQATKASEPKPGAA